MTLIDPWEEMRCVCWHRGSAHIENGELAIGACWVEECQCNEFDPVEEVVKDPLDIWEMMGGEA